MSYSEASRGALLSRVAAVGRRGVNSLPQETASCLAPGGTWAREEHPATEVGADPCIAGNVNEESQRSKLKAATE